jgi:hypothetical protein
VRYIVGGGGGEEGLSSFLWKAYRVEKLVTYIAGISNPYLYILQALFPGTHGDLHIYIQRQTKRKQKKEYTEVLAAGMKYPNMQLQVLVYF